MFKKLRAKVDQSKRKEFFEALLGQVNKLATDLQRSKYNIEDLSIEQEEFLTIEENLMDGNFRELESMENVELFHIEIKMKSSLDVLSRSKMENFVEKFLIDKTESELTDIALNLTKMKGNRAGAEFSQFFMRDLMTQFDSGKTEKKPKKKAKNLFDGRAFFLEGLDQRVDAIRKIAEQETNYFRVFDKSGNRLHFEDYDKVLSGIFQDWRVTFCNIVGSSINLELLRAVTFMQNLMTNSLGDSMAKLVSLGYEEVKREKGVEYLWDCEDLIVRAIVEVLDENYMNKPIDLDMNYFDQIKQKVGTWLEKSGQTYENLDLKVIYICILTSMTFCDTSVILKIALHKDTDLKKTPAFENSSKLVAGSLIEANHCYHYASKLTLIDFGAKKDSNLQNLLETFKGLSYYSDYLQKAHIPN